MAIERRKRCAKTLAAKETTLRFVLTSTTGALAADPVGDFSLVTSITDVGAGEFTLNLSQAGNAITGYTAHPQVATPGTGEPQSCNLKSYSLTNKTFTFVMQKGDGAADDLADNDKVYVTLTFNDSYGQ